MTMFWRVICSNAECSSDPVKECTSIFYEIMNPYSCISQLLILSADILIGLVILSMFLCKSVYGEHIAPFQAYCYRLLLYVSAIFNVILGLAYLGSGFWIIVDKYEKDRTLLPLNSWLVLVCQGFTWLLITLVVSIRKKCFRFNAAVKFCSVLAFLVSTFLCFSSLWTMISERSLSLPSALSVLSFPGSIMFLFCIFNKQVDSAKDNIVNDDDNACYEPLSYGKDNVTPFENSGFFSQMTFWWLNPLIKEGNHKLLQEEDIPLLREKDRARTCYATYVEKLWKLKCKGSADSPSLLSVIVSWQWKGFLISGCFALIKVLTLSTEPLFLRAFIRIAQGNEAFKYEGCVLTVALFLAKVVESVSQRQWYFRTRIIGLQLNSMLSSAIYQKQLKLSNAAKVNFSSGEVVSYVTTDAYRVGEFPYWFHQCWTTLLQMCGALAIVYYSIRLATFAAFTAVILLVLAGYPLVKLRHRYQTKLMVDRDKMLKFITEALANMKILKLYAWETHFKNVVEKLREEEFSWISKVLQQAGYNLVLSWMSPTIIPAITFWTCYILKIPLSASDVFTFLASLRIVQQAVILIPDVAGVLIDAKVSLDRIARFLGAPELQSRNTRQDWNEKEIGYSILVECTDISWNSDPSSNATLKDISLVVRPGEKVAICGAVGSGKSTLLASVLGEVPKINGTVQVFGRLAYVSQTAWIQNGTIQENILFGLTMDPVRYQEVIHCCSLVKDLEMLPLGDLTEIGERGVNLSGGQKQRVQLARALYQDSDIYLLDDPFSAVDAHTATSLFNEYVIKALNEKTVLLVTHQVDFLPAFNSILLMSGGEIDKSGTYDQLLSSSKEFQDLVNVHKSTEGERKSEGSSNTNYSRSEIQNDHVIESQRENVGDRLIKQEEREKGDTGLKPYMQYLSHKKGFLFFSLATAFHIMFILGQILQAYFLAAYIQNSGVSKASLFALYSLIALALAVFLFLRSFNTVLLGCGASESIFAALLTSLFQAPMSFYDSTPLGRILTRVSSDLSIVDLEVAFRMTTTSGSMMILCSCFAVLCCLTWPVTFVIIPTAYLTIFLQRYYHHSAKELMRINGTSKSTLASYLAESIAGATIIRAFGQENRFFMQILDLIDRNASPYFHSVTANEWLVQRLEMLCAIILSSTTLATVLLHLGASASGFIGMELAYGLSINTFLVLVVQFQCMLSNLIVSVERLEQYMHIPSEAPDVIENNRPEPDWPQIGKVEIHNLTVRYQANAPLILQGLTCTIEGGSKIGIVGRTGSGKTTLISTLFRLVEPESGGIIIDNINISTIGLHDLRSRIAVIPQDPTLFNGSVRYNLNPLSLYTDQEVWDVLEKCHLREVVESKEEGLEALVAQDGSNWSMGQRQLFCLGRALLKHSMILVLDEATASIDNTTDSILQRTIRSEFAECTVITVAHRIPTVMNCDKVLAISEGKLIEYDEPSVLMNKTDSLFGQLVKEYWSRTSNSTCR